MMAINHPTCDPKKKPMKYKAIYKTKCMDIEILNIGGFVLFISTALFIALLKKNFWKHLPNGLRYLRWGGDGEAVQPEKG